MNIIVKYELSLYVYEMTFLLLLYLKKLYSQKRYFLNPSLTKSSTYVLSFPYPSCQVFKPSKE